MNAKDSMLISADVESRSAASASSCGKKKKGLQMIQRVNAASAHINAMDSVCGFERLTTGRRLLAGFALPPIF